MLESHNVLYVNCTYETNLNLLDVWSDYTDIFTRQLRIDKRNFPYVFDNVHGFK